MNEDRVRKISPENINDNITDEDVTLSALQPAKQEKTGKGDKSPKNVTKGKSFFKSEFFSWIRVIIIAVAIALIFNCFIVINSIVPSGSMESTIMTGSRMFGYRLAYLFDEPERGDIIIFRYPDDKEKTFVKRIIGEPGDTVEIKAGITYVNGEKLDEPYLNEDVIERDWGPYSVPEGCYFVMGDNRNNSNDSRMWTNTYVERDDILAKAILCYWPISRFGILK